MLESLGRRGLWDAVSAFQQETGLEYDPEKRVLSEELYSIMSDIEDNDLTTAIAWCDEHKHFLASGPQASSLPYHLHRAKFLSFGTPTEAIAYARSVNLQTYMGSQPVLSLITSCLFGGEDSPYTNDPAPLTAMFRDEYCRFHGWSREEPLEVVVNLGSRGGALNAIEKARRVMGERLGNVRNWPELPVSRGAGLDANPPDGGAPACNKEVPLGLRLSRLQGAGNRDQPAKDAHLRARHCPRVVDSSLKGRVGCSTPPYGADPQSSHRQVPILPHGDISQQQPTPVLLSCYISLDTCCLCIVTDADIIDETLLTAQTSMVRWKMRCRCYNMVRRHLCVSVGVSVGLGLGSVNLLADLDATQLLLLPLAHAARLPVLLALLHRRLRHGPHGGVLEVG